MGFFFVGGLASVLMGPLCDLMDRAKLMGAVVGVGGLAGLLTSVVCDGKAGTHFRISSMYVSTKHGDTDFNPNLGHVFKSHSVDLIE